MQIQKPQSIEFEQQLKLHGLKLTRARKAIFDTLLSVSQPITIKQIADRVEEAHFVSIYRSVDALHRAGIIKMVPQGFKNCFELSDTFKPHHHHATCEICYRSIEINDSRIEKIMEQLTKQAGMKPTKHHFEAYGICKDCQRT